MYAAVGDAVPEGDAWAFEPKYDGVRVLAHVEGPRIQLITRNGKDKSAQFPEVTEAVRRLAARTRGLSVIDGEIVALEKGAPRRFQHLQARMHVRDLDRVELHREESPAALVAFDVLVDRGTVLLREPWQRRRALLEKRIASPRANLLLTESIIGAGERMLARAHEAGWEGIIAKRAAALYYPGRRSPDWRKLKIEFRQEFVVGGFTEPRNSREHLGALLLGYFDSEGRLIYVGHTGGGFTREGLRDMRRRLDRLRRATPPFSERPRTNERAHWVRPQVVVEVRFNEWTADGRLRQPIFLGVRDDKDAADVGRERGSVQR